MDGSAELLLERDQASGAADGSHVASAVRERLVVIGNGMASHKLCERLAACEGAVRYEVTVIGEEPQPAYDRVHLTDFLGGRSPEALALASRDWYAAQGIALRTGVQAVAIDREARSIALNDGNALPFDKLVLATGSRPMVPAMEGTDLPGVFVYRTVADLTLIRDRARTAQTAAVIGGGLLGLEAARAIQNLGVACQVVEYAPHVLCTQLDSRAGQLAQSKIEALGIQVHVNVRVSRITADGFRRVLHFAEKDQSSITVDFVVIAAGIRPRHELAEACGLTIAVPGGILVNDRLETSDPAIYAIGECASHRGAIYGLVAPAYRMAEVLAGNLSGGSGSFEGCDSSTRLKVLGLDVAVLGDYNQPGNSYSWESGGLYRRIVVKHDRLIGASALGEWPEAGEVQDAVMKSRRVWAWQVRRFQRRGVLWRPRLRKVNQWPDTATVCNCMNVSCEALRRVRDGGCQTVQALAQATGAGTLCGSCRPLLAELLGTSPPEGVERGSRTLGVASAVAALLVAGVLFLPAIPYVSSVQSFPYDAVWRNGLLKQASGFTLLGLSLLSLVMSLRKRIRSFKLGDFSVWRALHGVMGAAGLLMLVAHTGLRFGSNLNFALMSCFVLANLAGAAAGGTVSSSGLAASGSVRVRRCLLWGHIALVWPLPVLVAFHILSVYYF